MCCVYKHVQPHSASSATQIHCMAARDAIRYDVHSPSVGHGGYATDRECPQAATRLSAGRSVANYIASAHLADRQQHAIYFCTTVYIHVQYCGSR